MPNHITSRCTVTGPADEIARFKETMIKIVKDNFEEFDFNAAIPMPPILREVISGSISEDGLKLVLATAERKPPYDDLGMYPAQIKRIRDDVGMPAENIKEVAKAYLAKHPDWKEQGLLRLRAILETGYGDWYSWSIDNWGTKWNSYDFDCVSYQPLCFKFDTAWSFPFPVFKKISEMFPKLSFYCICFDEGWGFGGKGYFNPPPGEAEFGKVKATEELYQEVYGRTYEREEES